MDQSRRWVDGLLVLVAILASAAVIYSITKDQSVTVAFAGGLAG